MTATEGGPAPRVAVVTGAGSGIGAAAARALAGEGCAVACLDLDREAAVAVAAEIGGGAIGAGCDVGDGAEVERAAGELLAAFGRVDCLVNCAGRMCIAAASEIPEAEWTDTISVNFGGALRLAQALYPELRRGRSPAIVNVTSISQLRGQPGLVAYAASKAALESMTRTLAVEWAGDGIRVNAVAPGHVMTGMVREALSSGALPEADLRGWERRIPLEHRLATPAEIAAAIAFLAGERSGYVTGQSIVVDGALTVNGSYD